jgi:hypothetical protein
MEGQTNLIRTIKRAPDGTWLDHLGNAAVGRDGSVAVEEGSLTAPGKIHLYSREGDPQGTIQLLDSFADFAYDGQRVAVVHNDQVLLFNKRGESTQGFTLVHSKDKNPAWKPFLLAERGELLIFDGEQTMHRYKLP